MENPNKTCLHCDEEIKDFERVPVFEGKIHRECMLRSITGSVAHQRRLCLCYGGTGEDDPNLTKRENARAAAAYFEAAQNLDWQKALTHFRAVRRRYQEVQFEPGVDTSIALQYLFKPLSKSYFEGDRSLELYQLMMNLE